MDYRAWFQCAAGCYVRYPLNEVVYQCHKCGELLEVRHDVAALKHRSAAGWIRLFDERYMRTEWPHGSGVWGKQEWVNPHIERANIVSMFEGGSNLFWAERFGRQIGVSDLWVKQCGNSHTGSFKDLGMTVLVSQVKQMISEGQDILGVACASTGDTSAALAAYCAAAGIQAIVILPRNKVSTAQLIQPIANGALTLALDTDFDGCMKIVQEITADKSIYLANSMNSLRIEGQKTVAIEIVQQFDWEVPDWLVLPCGNLGNVSALGNGFMMMLELGLITRLPRIVAVQAHNATPFYQSYLKGFQNHEAMLAEPTLASAIQIGNPVSIRRAIKTMLRFDGIVEEATEDELANASARADLTGLFNCPHTGVAIAGLIKLIDRGVIKKNHRVVVVSTAHGLKFTDFKVKYHQGEFEGIESRYANPPVELPADVDKVRDAIRRAVDRRRAAQ